MRIAHHPLCLPLISTISTSGTEPSEWYSHQRIFRLIIGLGENEIQIPSTFPRPVDSYAAIITLQSGLYVGFVCFFVFLFCFEISCSSYIHAALME